MSFLKILLTLIFMWLTICLILSLLGWYWLALKYKYKGDFNGTRIGVISATINYIVGYSNAIVIKVNNDGLYLKPLLIFSFFHEPLLIPWAEIKKVKDSRFLFIYYKELFIGDLFVSVIKIRKSTFLKIEQALNVKS